MTPELASISPTVGHFNGTKLTAKVHGVGVNSHGNFTLTSGTDVDICAFSYWTGYSDFVCYTTNTSISSTLLKVKNISSSTS